MLDLYIKEYNNNNKIEFLYFDFYKRYSDNRINLERFKYKITKIEEIEQERNGG